MLAVYSSIKVKKKNMEQHLFLNTYDSFPLTEHIMDMMRSAKKYIKTGNFMFREPDMKQEILNALNRGVVVFILSNLGEDAERLLGYNHFSKKEYDNHLPNLNDFAEQGAHVRCMGELHAKFLVVDGERSMVMSSNYTKDSLHGNPECGVDLDAENTNCLERIFDTLFVHADDKIEGRDKAGYRFSKVESFVNPNVFTEVLKCEIKMTLAAIRQKDGEIQDTNFCNCKIMEIYESISDMIKKAEEFIYLIAYSFKSLGKLPEIRSALIDAAKRGVSVYLIYNSGNSGSQEEIKKMRAISHGINGLGVPKNHAKLLLTDKDAMLFTANIDGEAGLLSGFELGVFLDDSLWDEAKEVINTIVNLSKSS